MGQKRELAEYRNKMDDLIYFISCRDVENLNNNQLSECIDIVDSALKEMK